MDAELLGLEQFPALPHADDADDQAESITGGVLQDCAAIRLALPDKALEPNELICSGYVKNAFQLDQGDKVRLLDQSFHDLFITGSGKPVWCLTNNLAMCVTTKSASSQLIVHNCTVLLSLDD